jgi:hypothetical protein
VAQVGAADAIVVIVPHGRLALGGTVAAALAKLTSPTTSPRVRISDLIVFIINIST